MEQTLQQKRREIVIDTCKHYNSNNRCHLANRDSYCQYTPTSSMTEGCAIGRLIKDKELCKELDGRPASSVQEIEVFNKLPENLRELGQTFLIDLQLLHDSQYNWNENGISEAGIRKRDFILKRYC